MSGGHISTKRFVSRLWYLGSTIAVIIVLIIAVAMVVSRFFGLQIFTVTSGSMEPSYPVGSLIYTIPVDTANLKVGDVITFANSSTSTVTHRISEIVTDTSSTGIETLKFRTKGDNNKNNDGKLVLPQNIIGKPILVIPLLGYVSFYLQRPPGIYIALITCTFLISLIIIPSIIKHKRKEPAVEQASA